MYTSHLAGTWATRSYPGGQLLWAGANLLAGVAALGPGTWRLIDQPAAIASSPNRPVASPQSAPRVHAATGDINSNASHAPGT